MNNLKLEKEELKNNKIDEIDLKWLSNFKKNGYINIIDRNIINEFIDNIYVDDNKNVKIEFKFNNKYEEAIMYLKNKDNMI